MTDTAPTPTPRRRFPYLRAAAPVVPVVSLSGVIASRGYGQRLSIDSVTKPLDRAFGNRDAVAVAIVINSPGGSPVQANLIHQRIRALAAEKKKPVIAFVEDVAASGGYLVALAADEIIADRNSVIGSIGVVSAGFGFTGLMEKLGVERRLYTAGKSKAMLDPFSPEKKADVEHLRALQEEIHQWFIALVKARRPGLSTTADLFNGAYWTGAAAVTYGLIDRLGDVRTVMRERYGDKVKLPVIAERRGMFRRLVGGTGGGLAAQAADAMISAAEDRAEWQRFGL
ncbi:MAG: S49 family peptidase [Bauldia sp.]